MLIWAGEPDYKLIAVQEGSGDNLDSDDIENGYVDYYMLSTYEQDGDELKLVDGGQLLLKTPIEDMDFDERIEAILDYCGVHNNYSVLEA